MRSIILPDYNTNIIRAMKSLHVADRPIRTPGSDQVLIKVAAAPCNPSDIAFMRGGYNITRPVPVTMGFECTGTVVETGMHPGAAALKGRRISCFGRDEDDGTWAEYFLTSYENCIVVKDTLPVVQAAALCINPFTAYAMMELAMHRNARAIVQNGASGQIGVFIRKLARKYGITVINLVRKDEHLEMLQAAGEKHNINLSDPESGQKLSAATRALHALVAFDAVGGEISGLMLNAMPPGSELILYGGLSGKPLGQFNALDIIFHDKSIRGFNLNDWKASLSKEQFLAVSGKVQDLVVDGTLETTIQGIFPLEDVQTAMEKYIRNMSGGKILFKP